MKKSRRIFALAMLVCLIVGVIGIRECIGAACALAFVNVTLGLEDLEKKTEDKK